MSVCIFCFQSLSLNNLVLSYVWGKNQLNLSNELENRIKNIFVTHNCITYSKDLMFDDPIGNVSAVISTRKLIH